MSFSFHYPAFNSKLASIYQQAAFMRDLAAADCEAASSRLNNAHNEYARLDEYIEAIVKLLKVADRTLWLRVVCNKDEQGRPLPSADSTPPADAAPVPALTK